MGLTIAEKLISRSLAEGQLARGGRIGVRADQVLAHDVNGVMAFLALEAMALEKVKVGLAVQYIDHNMIQADYKNSDDHRFLQDMTARLGVICSRPGSGICHQLHMEHWGVPGRTLLGTDSHTVAAGGMGMFAVGVGGFDGAMAMAGEPFFLTMPKIVNIRLTGKLPPFVSAKNVVLELLRRVSVKGGGGRIYEYGGSGVLTLNVAERCLIANMGQETGATTSVFPSDENTRSWLRAYRREEQWTPLQADPDAVYDEVIEIDLSRLEPLIALPHQPDRVVPVREAAGIKVDQVMMGSCTNASLQDVLSIAHILGGKPIHRDVDAGLYPATRTVMRESIARGAYDKIAASGVRIFEPVCGGCNGCGFAPQSNGVSLRTTPRNFLGRSGTATGMVYLVAPETAAASALTGVITDPRELGLTPLSYALPETFVDDRDVFQPPSPEPEKIVVRRGPNLRPIPDMPALPAVVGGEVLVKVGDDITTDHICPAGALYLPIRSNIPELSKHAFKAVDDTFADRAQQAGGGWIVGGANYGQGSSREQAVMVPRYLGVKAVLAKSFARLHLANMPNWGLLPLVFVDPADYDAIRPGDELELDTADLREGRTYVVKNTTTGARIAVSCPLSSQELGFIKAGGRLNQVRAKNKTAGC